MSFLSNVGLEFRTTCVPDEHIFIASFVFLFQSSAYKASVEKEISVENKKNSELVKREKQLKSQIDNLISDSLALLKRRLDELGIQVITDEVVLKSSSKR